MGWGRAGPDLGWAEGWVGLGLFGGLFQSSGCHLGWWASGEGNPIPVTNERGNLHLPSAPRPFLVAVVLGVWEAGRVLGKTTRVVLTYGVLGEECGS